MMPRTTRHVIHCWEDYRSTLDFGGDEWAATWETGNATCMLESGHEGPHEWTKDAEIRVRFL